MFFIAGILNLLSSYLIASVAGNFLAIYVVFFAFIIINVEILSLLNGIYGHNIVILSFLNLIFAILFFKYKKAKFLTFDIDLKKLKNAFLLDKALIILSIAFLVLISVSAFLSYVMPPLEPDAQTYHFLRAYEFYQNHNLQHFEINDSRAVIMPINSEIVYVWLFGLRQKMYSFAFLSYFSYFAVIFSIWQILAYLKYSIRKRLFAIFIFSSFASTIVEMSCLQTDIVIGGLYISSFALFLKKNYFLSALAMAIAFGTKSTAVAMFIPYLLIIFLLNKKDLPRYIGYLILNFIIFSSYNYILNFIDYGNPISNNSIYMGHKFWGGVKGYISNIIHYIFQFLDFTGFTWGYYLNNKIFALENSVYNFIHLDPDIGRNVSMTKVNITTDEQIVGFGILGFLALIPAVIKGIFNKNKTISLLAASFVVNLLILSGYIAYLVYSIRFMVAYACFCAPILAILYSKKGLYKTLVCLFCIFYMSIIPFHIRRQPFYQIMPFMIKNNFNMDKFVHACYEGYIAKVWEPTPILKKIITEKYKDRKKIGFFKTAKSSALYLKFGLDVDFLVPTKINEYDLSKYDLLIFEGEIQDDDTYKQAKIEYNIEGENVHFTKDGLNCYYDGDSKTVALNEKIARKCICFTVYHFDKNINTGKNKLFTLDYVYNHNDEPENIINYYFYTKLN